MNQVATAAVTESMSAKGQVPAAVGIGGHFSHLFSVVPRSAVPTTWWAPYGGGRLKCLTVDTLLSERCLVAVCKGPPDYRAECNRCDLSRDSTLFCFGRIGGDILDYFADARDWDGGVQCHPRNCSEYPDLSSCGMGLVADIRCRSPYKDGHPSRCWISCSIALHHAACCRRHPDHVCSHCWAPPAFGDHCSPFSGMGGGLNQGSIAR